MILPVMTAIVIIFILWINYEILKSTKLNKDDEEKFWNREKLAFTNQRNSISSLDYITISTELLPMSETFDETANSYRDIILGLSGKKAINLSRYTNTELKIKYGAANIRQLAEFDNNFTQLVSILWKWASRLYSLGLYQEALAVLTYSVICKTDVSNSYLLLAQLYRKQNDFDNLDALIHTVRETKIHNKEKLIEKLLTLMNS